MKARESGMPDEKMWQSFFNPEVILTALKLDNRICDAADFGCGYGTFTLPAALRIKGTLYGFDIDAAMIGECNRRAQQEGITNLQLFVRDFVKNGTGLAPESVDYTMLFNILHAEEPLLLLHEAWRILKPHGRVAIIHWNFDPTTPRGPSMDIRPRPADCQKWTEQAGFEVENGIIDLPPYHYGLVGRKSDSLMG
jgi:SAM-dependent methyltransferase